MPYFKSGEGKIFYRAQGAGTALVFIHGALGSHNLWERQVPLFSSKYRVVTLDVRGHGSSFKPHTGYQLQKMLEDIRGLLNYLSIRKAVLIGSSMGGVIAQMFACEDPSRVKALVLVGTLAKAIWFGKADQHAKTVASEGYNKGVISWFTPDSKRKDIRMALLAASKVSPYFLTGVILENPNWDIRKDLSRIVAPTLVIVGKEDTNTTPVRESRIIHRLIANSIMRIVPGAGHLVMLEKPEVFNEMLYRFLKENRL